MHSLFFNLRANWWGRAFIYPYLQKEAQRALRLKFMTEVVAELGWEDLFWLLVSDISSNPSDSHHLENRILSKVTQAEVKTMITYWNILCALPCWLRLQLFPAFYFVYLKWHRRNFININVGYMINSIRNQLGQVKAGSVPYLFRHTSLVHAVGSMAPTRLSE